MSEPQQQPVTFEDPPRTFFSTLSRLGPGLIIAGSIVGSGELIATTKVGAEAGFYLLWLILIGCVIKVFAQVEFGRYAIVSNLTPLRALDGVPGPRWKVNWVVWYWAIMTVLILSQQGGIIGGVGQTLAISRPLTAQGAEFNQLQDQLIRAQVELESAKRKDAQPARIELLESNCRALRETLSETAEPPDAYLWGAIIAVATSVLLFIGHYGMIQTVATVLVAMFTFITILTLIVLQTRPTWAIQPAEIAQGLSFRLPPIIEGLAANPVATALAAFGIIGVGASELTIYPYWCLEKGYAKFTGPPDGSSAWFQRARGWIRVLQVDAWLSMVVYTFATVAFYLLGAAVLGRSGLNPAKSDMIRTLSEMYVPVFGSWAPLVFLFGAFSVLYSTLFVAAAGNARIVSDSFGLFGLHDGSETAREKWTRILSMIWPLIALLMYVFVRAPAAMVLASGIAQSIMLPMLGIAVLYFRYRRTPQPLQPGRTWDLLLWISCGGFLIVGAWSLYSILLSWFGG
jgi:Mn2+/Fe2+ NRAMP family transporter